MKYRAILIGYLLSIIFVFFSHAFSIIWIVNPHNKIDMSWIFSYKMSINEQSLF
jgi:hypothetical protein